jgi:branched-chain amino acid transport system substrate-binding protein
MAFKLTSLGHISRRHGLTALASIAALGFLPQAQAAEPIKIGLVTALSGSSALAGEAITRGMTIAIDEINAAGGLLGGRPLELVRRDDESNPSKGVVAARELIHREKVAVIFGGLDTPVAFAMLPLVQQAKMPLMVPWAAGTGITHNGAKENYVFRVSAVDELVDVSILDYAVKTFDTKKPGLVLVNNAWGESNEKGLKAALKAKGMEDVGVEKIEASAVDVVPQLSRLKAAGADALFLVANVAPSAQVVKSLDRMGWSVPIVSHWGPPGGRFSELAGPNADSVHFVQTYSFFSGEASPVRDRLVAAMKAKYSDVKGPDNITPAVGVANAYDAMHLTALAIQAANSTEGEAIRQGYYKIGEHQGLIKTYNKPFSATQHDALTPDDYVWAQFVGDRILPVGMAK